MAENITPVGNSIALKIIKYWVPVLVMIGAMYYASTDILSGENTRSLTDKIVLWLRPGTSERTLSKVHYAVRKAGHFTEYALLAALLFRAFRADAQLRWRFKWAACSFAISAVCALLDEFHQTFTHSRGGSIFDSLIDSSGALFMLLVIAFFNRKKSAPAEVSTAGFSL